MNHNPKPAAAHPVDSSSLIKRRAFLKSSTLILTASAMTPADLMAADTRPSIRIGMVTDLHYADKPPVATRYFRETPRKLEEVGARFQQQPPDFVVELGDLIDAADSVEGELRNLKTINSQFSALSKDRHYVLGNHCVDTLKKEEFLGGVEQEKSYYSFNRGDYHFIVLDACFRSDGQPYGRKNSTWKDTYIPPAELEWLEADLKSTDKPTIVFAHQRLDVSSNHGVRNCTEVRKRLETSQRVLAVFQGHSHKNDHNEIGGIHYCTLVAMIEGSGLENNGYSLLSIDANKTIRIEGFRKQANYNWI